MTEVPEHLRKRAEEARAKAAAAKAAADDQRMLAVPDVLRQRRIVAGFFGGTRCGGRVSVRLDARGLRQDLLQTNGLFNAIGNNSINGNARGQVFH